MAFDKYGNTLASVCKKYIYRSVILKTVYLHYQSVKDIILKIIAR